MRNNLFQVEEGGSAVCDQDEDEEEQNIFTVDSTENLFQIVWQWKVSLIS